MKNCANWLRSLGVIILFISGSIACSASERPDAVSFKNDIMAVLSKAGCNAGTCHGNKNGKGGFKLSLRGEDPEADYLTLTRGLLGRRVDLIKPEESLILLKPTTQVSHEGGLRFKFASAEYELLRRWLAARVPNDLQTAPRLLTLTVSPSEQVLVEPTNEFQLRVQATYSDASSRDITSLAVYETSNPHAKVSAEGRVTRQRFGETTLLVRYLDQQKAIPLAFVPARPAFQWQPVRPNNYIDEHIFAKLKQLRMSPSDLCSDAVFIRRAYLDLLGLLPTAHEAQDFTADKSRDKRQELIESLLNRPEFADFWALKWADLLRVEAHSLDQKGVQNFHHWILQSVASNKPVDQFVRELVNGLGSTYSNPSANFYRPNRDPARRAKAAAQVLLGTRLQCAECHNHPSDRWTQDDYYDWAAMFAPVKYKVIENKREIGSDQHEWNGEQIVFASRQASLKNPRTDKPAEPRFLGEAGPRTSTSAALALWLTNPTNNLFARVHVNRIWFHLMGRGLVDPPDDYRATNPASHPQLLDALANDFAKHQFDMRHIIRLIMNSRTYQLSSEPNDTNQDDEVNYSHGVVRRLGAEQLLDAQSQVTEVPLRFAGYPAGMRAAQLPGVRPESKGKRRANSLDLFLDTFGKPPRLLSSDTERSCECNISQAFQMISGPTVSDLLSEKTNRITRLAASGKTNCEILDELFWTALTRPPTEGESNGLLPKLESAKDLRVELEDILWALLNSKEFLFRR